MQTRSRFETRKSRSCKPFADRTDLKWPGMPCGGQYRGYVAENGVPEGSITPTYAALRLDVDNWRWRDVPFYLRTGKAMAEKTSEIVIEFQKPPHSMFPFTFGEEIPSNFLRITLQPNEGIHLGFQTKTPDTDMGSMERTNLEFHYRSAFRDLSIPEDYERLLQDALLGDASLFIRNDHIEEAWKIVDPLIEAWTEANTSPSAYLRARKLGACGS